MPDRVDLSDIIRQIEILQRAADRVLAQAYRSQDGKGKINEGLLRQGQEYIKQAEMLIEQNLVPILQSLNPAHVTAALAAASASPVLTAKVVNILNAARAAATAGMSTAAICEAISIAVPILLAVVGVAILGLLYKSWLDRKYQKEGEKLLKQYEDRITKRPAHVPFQPRMIPGRL